MLGAISRHVATLRRLDASAFEAGVLRAFVKIQNGEPGAQTPAQYGLKLCPGAGKQAGRIQCRSGVGEDGVLKCAKSKPHHVM
jgi:hypothetical protein